MDAPPVQYVTTSDGYNIAYTVSGEGQPLVFMPVRFSHLEAQWSLPSNLTPWIEGLAARFRLVRYDGRGQGMSTRGLDAGVTMDALGRDLEAVVEHLKLERFVLLGYGWSAHVAVNYAVRHSERVRMLVLLACSVSGAAWPGTMHESLADQDWELFLRSQTGLGHEADVSGAFQMMKLAITPSDYAALMHAFRQSDLQSVLPNVQTPTLVIHGKESLLLRPEESIKVAVSIPRSRMMLTEGPVLFGDASQGLRALDDFVTSISAEEEQDIAALASVSTTGGLSQREVEVLRLVAAGHSNQQIADQLVISLNTVRRHVSNVFDKTGVANRTEASVYARDRGLA